MIDADVTYLSIVLDTPVKTLYMLSNHPSSQRKHPSGYSNYRRAVIRSKSTGKVRVLHIPNPLLKGVQQQILRKLLSGLPVSAYAAAYQRGCKMPCRMLARKL